MIESTLEDPQAIERAWATASMAGAVPAILRELDNMATLKLKVAFKRLNEGVLTPEQALTTLIEMKSFHDLEHRLQSKTRE